MSKMVETLNGFEPKNHSETQALQAELSQIYQNCQKIDDPALRKKHDVDRMEEFSFQFLKDYHSMNEGNVKYSQMCSKYGIEGDESIDEIEMPPE